MKKATMKDIADRVGLTRQAVSVILNRKTPTSGHTRPHGDATRQKVLAVARELGYRPNYFAQSLTRGKTSCIGIMGSGGKTLGFHSPHFTRMASAVEYRLEDLKSPYSLITFGANYHERSYARTIELVGKGMVDGLLVMLLARDIPSFEENLLPVLRTNNTPFVVVHTLSKKLDYDNVGRDTFHGGRIMARHLAQAGHTEFGYVRPEAFEAHYDWEENYRGFVQGLIDEGRSEADVRPLIIAPGVSGERFSRGYEALRAAGSIPSSVTTIVSEMGYGAEKAIRGKGMAVPGDVALMGGEDEKAPVYIEKHLSGISNPLEEMGRTALNMLLERLADDSKDTAVRSEIIKPELIVRETA